MSTGPAWTPDKQAEAIDRLSKSSLERFKTRLDWEWKARLGLWTALGVAAGFTLGSDKWQPTMTDFFVVLIAMIVLVGVYAYFFALSVHQLHAEDLRLWQAYDRKAAELIWAPDPVPADAMPSAERSWWAKCLSIGQLAVTALFALVLAWAVGTRAFQKTSHRDHSKVTIEQGTPAKVLVEPAVAPPAVQP